LIVDKNNFDPEDPKLIHLKEEDAKNILFNILPKSFHKSFEKIFKDGNVVDNLYALTFPFQYCEISLTIDFPYVTIEDGKLNVTWHFVNKFGEKDIDTWSFSPNDILTTI
jgi:hypothetical protein